MSVATARDSAAFRLPFYYGWVNVLLAAVAMTATLPGRTHGLGLITEPLLRDLQLDPVRYASFNLWATLIGASFCLVIGPLIDRCGTRVVLTGVALLLGITTCAMSRVTSEVGLIVTLTLTRGLGQSALSVVSMAMVGKWFQRRIGPAMGVFTVLLTIGFIATTLGVGHAVKTQDWRTVWNVIGMSLIVGLVPLGALFVRSVPRTEELSRCGRDDEFLEADSLARRASEGSKLPMISDPSLARRASEPIMNPPRDALRLARDSVNNLTLGEALRQPAFWALAFGTSAFNLIWSATTLFNESILKERGLPDNTFVNAMAAMTATGLAANSLAGWAATKYSMSRLLSVGLLALAPMLFLYPRLTSASAAIWQGAGMGLVGGIITVVFFSAWSRVFGRAHLGRIQGTAQLISVFASAVGPLLLTATREWTGSFATFFETATLIVLGLAAWSWFVSEPHRDSDRVSERHGASRRFRGSVTNVATPVASAIPLTAALLDGRGTDVASDSITEDVQHA